MACCKLNGYNEHYMIEVKKPVPMPEVSAQSDRVKDSYIRRNQGHQGK